MRKDTKLLGKVLCVAIIITTLLIVMTSVFKFKATVLQKNQDINEEFFISPAGAVHEKDSFYVDIGNLCETECCREAAKIAGQNNYGYVDPGEDCPIGETINNFSCGETLNWCVPLDARSFAWSQINATSSFSYFSSYRDQPLKGYLVSWEATSTNCSFYRWGYDGDIESSKKIFSFGWKQNNEADSGGGSRVSPTWGYKKDDEHLLFTLNFDELKGNHCKFILGVFSENKEILEKIINGEI